jgi:hypothetical protein
MKSIPGIVSRVSSGAVLCVSLSQAVQAAEKIQPSDCGEMKSGGRDLVKCEEHRRQGIDIVKGQVLQIEEGKYVVQRFYGKEVHLNVTARTQVTGSIGLGDSIEALVSEEKDQKYVLSIHQMK